MARFDNQPQLSEEPPWEPRLTPRVYWAMVRDLLNEALSFAIALRAAPYEAVDRSGRDVLLDAASQLVDAASCVLDAVESSTTALEHEGGAAELFSDLAEGGWIAVTERFVPEGSAGYERRTVLINGHDIHAIRSGWNLHRGYRL